MKKRERLGYSGPLFTFMAKNPSARSGSPFGRSVLGYGSRSTGLPVTENGPVKIPDIGVSAFPVYPGCLPPIEISKIPGSITLRLSLVITDTSRGSIVNVNRCEAPCFHIGLFGFSGFWFAVDLPVVHAEDSFLADPFPALFDQKFSYPVIPDEFQVFDLAHSIPCLVTPIHMP